MLRPGSIAEAGVNMAIPAHFPGDGALLLKKKKKKPSFAFGMHFWAAGRASFLHPLSRGEDVY